MAEVGEKIGARVRRDAVERLAGRRTDYGEIFLASAGRVTWREAARPRSTEPTRWHAFCPGPC